MAIQKKGLLIGGIVAVVIAAGGICAAVLPDALHKEESSISNGTVTTTTAAPASTDTENSDQAPETYQSVLSEYYTAFIQNQPDTLYRLMAPPAYWDYYMEHYNKTKEDVISTYSKPSPIPWHPGNSSVAMMSPFHSPSRACLNNHRIF